MIPLQAHDVLASYVRMVILETRVTLLDRHQQWFVYGLRNAWVSLHTVSSVLGMGCYS